MTLEEFIKLIAKLSNVDNVKYRDVDGERADTIYPSVTHGPVNIEKAEKEIGFEPNTLVS